MWFKILLPHQHYPMAAMVGKDGNIYFRLVDVGALLGRSNVHQFTKRFDNLVILRKDVLPVHKPYPVMKQKSKLVTPDVVFSILNAKLLSLATSFATSLNAGLALVEDPDNLFVESYKLSPVLHLQDSPVPHSFLVRKWVQDFIQKGQDMRRTQHRSKTSLEMARAIPPAESVSLPSERPAERSPLMDLLVNEVEVTSRIPTPPLITRCDKSIQTDPPHPSFQTPWKETHGTIQ